MKSIENFENKLFITMMIGILMVPFGLAPIGMIIAAPGMIWFFFKNLIQKALSGELNNKK